MNKTFKVLLTGVALGSLGASSGVALAKRRSSSGGNGAILGGVAGAVLGLVVGQAVFDGGSPSLLSDDKVDPTRRKLAEIARETLDGQMGWPSNAVWWYQGSEVAQDKDGGFFVLAKIHPGLPMDDMGWPYGLPHTSNGVQVRSSRAIPGWHSPGKTV